MFRTPISGGVQSATFAHGLPPPALAVRNLMEQVASVSCPIPLELLFGLVLLLSYCAYQARFAHLCTVMSGMHHRRAGYPFGSLVDFANDSMGRKELLDCIFDKTDIALLGVLINCFALMSCADPIFSLSPLAIHTRNLLSDPRCTLVVQVCSFSICFFTIKVPCLLKYLVLYYRYLDGVDCLMRVSRYLVMSPLCQLNNRFIFSCLCCLIIDSAVI